MATTRKTAAKKTTARKTAAARPAATADHLPPKAEQENEKSVKVEVHGETWTVRAETLDDFELLDDLNALDQRDDPTRMPSVLRRFLGDDQFSKAMTLLRKESPSGRVTIEAGSKFVWDLMAALNPNSSRS